MKQLILFFLVTIATSVLAGEPEATDITINKDYLSRSYLTNKDITSVDAFSGAMTLSLPLINIPGNDHLNMVLTLHHGLENPSLTGIARKTVLDRGSHVGLHTSVFTGIIKSIPDYNADHDPKKLKKHDEFKLFENPIFIDPNGHRHMLYPEGNYYYSKDLWRAQLSEVGKNYRGVVTSPKGVQYLIEPGRDNVSPTIKIKSLHGGSKIDYQYNQDGSIASIDNNAGYRINFHYIKKTFHTTVRTSYCDFSWGSGCSIEHIADEKTFTILDHITTSDNRQWTFKYQEDLLDLESGITVRPLLGVADPNLKTPNLTEIILPDNSKWCFGWISLPVFLGQINEVTYPSGGKIHFTYKNFSTLANLSAMFVVEKTVSGNGTQTGTWKYNYDSLNYNGISASKTTVIGPNKKVEYIFNAKFNLGATTTVSIGWKPIPTHKQGNLLERTVYSAKSSYSNKLESTAYTWNYRKISSQPWYKSVKYPNKNKPYNYKQGILSPYLTSRTISRYGKNNTATQYKTIYKDHNAYGMPQTVVEKSYNGIIKHTFKHYINKSKWFFATSEHAVKNSMDEIIDQQQYIYSDNALLIQSIKNGVSTIYQYKLGNMIQKTNALNKTTTLNHYKNGIAQEITNPLNQTLHYEVNTNGTIKSLTDATGNKTTYSYDPLYRVNETNPPKGLKTNIVWNTNGYSLTRGSYKKKMITTGFAKPYKVAEYDHDHLIRAMTYAYDATGKKIFRSYASNKLSNYVKGILTRFDGLGRISTQTQPYKLADLRLF